MSWLLCMIGLHNYIPQLHSFDEDKAAFMATGSLLPVFCQCSYCGKQRGPM